MKKILVVGLSVFIMLSLTACSLQRTETDSLPQLENEIEDNVSVEVDRDDTKTEDDKNSSVENDKNVKVVGDDEYGYITIPEKWGTFFDVNGLENVLQFSYANIYIMTLSYFDINQVGGSAKQAADNFMYNMSNDESVRNVEGAIVNVGEYEAYQVYMYYPSENKILITYFFDTNDGKVRYLALEGPWEFNETTLDEYLYIPESFSLTK